MEPLQNTLTFAADTALLVVVAYLVARGRLLRLLFRHELTHRQSLRLGVVLGMVGLIEALFPDQRFAYPTHTLFVSFAAIAGGLPVGLITAAIVSFGAFLSQTAHHGVGTILAVLVSAFAGKQVRSVASVRARLLGGFAVGALAQGCRYMAHSLLAPPDRVAAITHTWISIPVNGFGVMLLLLVITDAQQRAESENRRLEAERAHALASDARLSELRARLRPHFLFNTLNSIAELCRLDPVRAEGAIVRLASLMRRALDAGSAAAVPLSDELHAVREYLEIESERFGSRLKVDWLVDEGCEYERVPQFAIQTIVENAVTHGISPKGEPGIVTIAVRRHPTFTMIAVTDNGVGMDSGMALCGSNSADDIIHGLDLVRQHVELLHGRSGRLRVFSRAGHGTTVAFALPHIQPAGTQDR